jgi:hypothetical protein
MKSWMMGVALSGSLLAAGTARADQCQWIDAAAAKKAEALLAKQPKVIAFCEPCGDNAPGIPEVARAIEVTSPQAGYKEIQVNGKGIDLAYTFVQTSRSHYHNLAKLAGCEADGVSSSLAIADETPNGVLITADEHRLPDPPPPPVIDPIPVVVSVPTPAPPAPAPQAPSVIVYATTPAIPWLAIALTGLCGFGAGAFALLTVATLRRRRAMRPRATNLPLD